MAQDYVGSNNINLLLPNGQFGTRLQGGNDSASERYIFTELNPLTRVIFNSADDKVLRYLDDDGTPVEPEWYAPIIPMLLVNGSKGIGTGFSTDIPPFNPRQIIDYIIKKIRGEDTSSVQLDPYYEGFKGSISKIGDQKYLIKGVYTILDTKSVHITELPVGTWNDDYKEFLEKLIDGDEKKKGLVKEYIDMSTDKTVDITVKFNNTTTLHELTAATDEHGCSGLEKYLRLYTTQTNTNMHMFDEKEKLRKFCYPHEIIDYYMTIRSNVYVARKKYLLADLERVTSKLSNKAKFIVENLSGEVDLRRKKNIEVVSILKDRGYDNLEGDDYGYLVKMPMNSVTEENVARLLSEKGLKEEELTILKSTKENDMWLNELETLSSSYEKYVEKRGVEMTETKPTKKKEKKMRIKTQAP
jgi:DNA topoisomerase-2